MRGNIAVFEVTKLHCLYRDAQMQVHMHAQLSYPSLSLSLIQINDYIYIYIYIYEIGYCYDTLKLMFT